MMESADFVESDSPYFVGGDGLAISLAPGKEVDLNKTGITITVNGFNQETNENIDIIKDFVLSEKGQKIIEDTGYVSVIDY